MRARAGGLARPAAAYLATVNNKAASARPFQFRVGLAALALGGLVEGQSFGYLHRPAGFANRADYGGIDGELRTVPQWQTIAHDLDAPGVLHGGIEVHVGQTDVLGDTSARLAADAGQRPLKRDRPGGEHPAVAQAARWSPQGSTWPRQWQCLGANGGTRNCALGMRTSSCVGNTCAGQPVTAAALGTRVTSERGASRTCAHRRQRPYAAAIHVGDRGGLIANVGKRGGRGRGAEQCLQMCGCLLSLSIFQPCIYRTRCCQEAAQCCVRYRAGEATQIY